MISFFGKNWWKFLILAALAGAAVWWILVPWYIYENGTPAQARVLKVWDTNSTINDEPVYGLLLEVQPAGGPVYQVERSCRASYASQWLFKPGAAVQVKYYPRLPQRVVMTSASCDQEYASFWMIGLGTVGFIIFSFLITPLVFGRLLFQSDLEIKGIPARATVINTWDTGVTVNNQPRLGLLLHVFPESGEDFDIETKMIIPHSRLPGVYPGAELDIRYDPKKPSRILLVSAADAEASPDPAARLRRLDALLAEHLISQEEYDKMRQSVLDQM
jgi:hypothetical protein